MLKVTWRRFVQSAKQLVVGRTTILTVMIFFRFLDSEVELNDTIQEMHIIATVPELYHIVVELNTVQSLLQLLSHDNTGILDFFAKNA